MYKTQFTAETAATPVRLPLADSQTTESAQPSGKTLRVPSFPEKCANGTPPAFQDFAGTEAPFQSGIA